MLNRKFLNLKIMFRGGSNVFFAPPPRIRHCTCNLSAETLKAKANCIEVSGSRGDFGSLQILL